ncbi:MAG TPA: hypothetical protein VK176_13745, partial [Phycisphaerales bacterium]|nr:hypothetical protein [Phycisphaerales bacterium]
VASLEDHIQSLEASDLPDSRTIRSDLARLEMQNAELARVTEPLDANQLRDRFRELALTHRIRVDRIERRTRTSASRESRSSAPVAREAAAFSMSLRGAYSDMAEFIQAVHAEPGINRITGIRISSPSAEEKGHVSAIVETSHLRLHMPVAAQPAQKKGRKS